MSDDLAAMRALIPQYPGYAEEDDRLLSDRLTRAWVGSSLASVRERLAAELGPGELQRLDDLIFRCQFPNQRYIAVIEHAQLDDEVQGRLVGLDRKAIALAQASCSVNAAGLGSIMSEIDATFDERAPVSA
jgi:hypothetical protein